MKSLKGEEFGQNEKRYIRIAGILKGYPEMTIMKELIQNGDDAK